MRWLALFGAAVFAYLAIVPAGLIVSIFDSACAGGDCETSLAQDTLLAVLYAACFAGVAGSSVLLGLYALRPTVQGESLIRLALAVSLAAVAATLFALFALTYPFAALFTVVVGGSVYGALRRLNSPDRRSPDTGDSTNGHGKLNGHPG